LQTLIDAELAGSGIGFIVDDSTQSVTAWVKTTSRLPKVLVMVVLDTRQPDHWRVTIIDAARLRAIRRRLPGGVEQDAAAVEAVASIVVSAATALRDGLEVASQSVEEVLEQAPDGEADNDEAARPPVSDSDESTGAAPPPPPTSNVGIRAMLFGAGATFSRTKQLTRGWGGALGFTFFSEVSTRATLARFQEVVFDSAFGAFRATRTLFGLGVGKPVGVGDFQLEPEARFLFELVTREQGQSIEGVTALEGAHLKRFGGAIALRGRYPAPSLVGLEATLSAGYLLPIVRFVTNPNNSEIAVLWPWIAMVEIGIELNLY
jgi:hypothetical protein